MDVIHALLRYHNATPRGNVYHDVSGRLLQNLDKIGDMSIEEIADMCYSSPATVSRLARNLGFKNFGAFRTDVISAVAGYPFLNRCMPYEVSEKKRQPTVYLDFLHTILFEFEKELDMGCLDAAVGLIHDARKISLYSATLSDFTKLQMQYDLVIAGKETAFLADAEAQREDVRTLSEDCMVIALFGNSLADSFMLDTLERARATSAKVLAIVPKFTPGVRKAADLLLEFDSTKTAIDNHFYAIYIALLTLAFRTRYLD